MSIGPKSGQNIEMHNEHDNVDVWADGALLAN